MSISIDALASNVQPHKTILFLGAGSSIPSGAPSGQKLAIQLWGKLLGGRPVGEDLTEIASILERRLSRRPVVEEVRSILLPLEPTGGLLALPSFEWPSIYTTNYDCLLESAFDKANKPIVIIRSNYDWTKLEQEEGVALFKVHGCVTQDESLGHKARMILTERDYEEFESYRETLYSRLQTDLYTKDVLVIGHSLRDRHLKDLLIRAASIKRDSGAPGTIYVLLYERDEDRATLIEDRGPQVAFGNLDSFVHALAEAKPPTGPPEPIKLDSFTLPPKLMPTVIDVATDVQKPPNVQRMFNGGPASYADIQSGATFERVGVLDIRDQLLSEQKTIATIVGPAGVGKTTFSRKLLLGLYDHGLGAWEHKPDFPLHHDDWSKFERQLHHLGIRGVLLIDECTPHLRNTNILIDKLSNVENPSLSIVLTANLALWKGRVKSPNIFKNGVPVELRKLDDAEIDGLINLVASSEDISSLVDKEFRRLSRAQQRTRLRQRCHADMYVGLKNIFANESLDTIILREYNDLDVVYQEQYKYVAALEAIGTRVHRQLIIRMLGISPDEVAGVLDRLSGIIDEYDISPSEGLYGWATRHILIARTITEYKFSDYEELKNLFERLIDNLNPTVGMELRSLRDICDSEYGIGRLESNDRGRLYQRLVEIAPAERIPWHRLIRETLYHGRFEDSEPVIRRAREAVGSDGPIDRYDVRRLMIRSEKTLGISKGDRLAILRTAYERALENIGRHSRDKHAYIILCEVAVMRVEMGDVIQILDQSIEKLRKAEEAILDPQMSDSVRHFEAEWRRLSH